MDIYKTMDVVSSALTAERRRLNAIASNVANANSLKSADGEGPYKRKDVVLESQSQAEFGEALNEANAEFVEVKVAEVVEDPNPPRAVYQPDHPMADEKGYIYMPNVNPVEEMANMISAEKSFQQNVNVFQTTKDMALKALEIGGN
ncbi:MAG TPA: flagellar basal body rod protein FlgC [Bdellovibrionota bacterium]|jgi:flagellar basal-body rod protein FlgC|nr:flagellar basal body rod protein FlgC [Bdellovibrionota bacterium]